MWEIVWVAAQTVGTMMLGGVTVVLMQLGSRWRREKREAEEARDKELTSLRVRKVETEREVQFMQALIDGDEGKKAELMLWRAEADARLRRIEKDRRNAQMMGFY